MFFSSNLNFQISFSKILKVVCWQNWLLLSENVFLNPQKKFRFLSQLSEKISDVEIHTFWGSGQLMETAISIGSPLVQRVTLVYDDEIWFPSGNGLQNNNITI